jgi:putative hydrolase of the HAD superfamily
MRLELRADSYVVVDLDDTLYAEVDFVRSGFRSIAARLAPLVGDELSGELSDELWRRFQAGQDALGWVETTYGHLDDSLTVAAMLETYRTHVPTIGLGPGVGDFLARLREHGVPLGLVTDGRSVTQRNKLRALGIEECFDLVVISEEIGTEKPDPRNFLAFEERSPGSTFHFFGDNTAKDFAVPARLGWETVCLLDGGRHVHRQDLAALPRPDRLNASFAEVEVSCSSGCCPSGA